MFFCLAFLVFYTINMDTVYIQTKRYRLSLLRVPFTVWMVEENGLSLQERLMGLPGVFILDYGNLSITSVRANGGEDVSVMLNGVSLNSPQSGVFDLSLIPSFFIEEGYAIGVSGASMEDNGNLSSSVSLYTKKKKRELSFSAGSFGKSSTGGIYSWKNMDTGFYTEYNKNHYPYRDEFGNLHYRENASYFLLSDYFSFGRKYFNLNTFLSLRDAQIPEKLGSISGAPHKNEKLVLISGTFDKGRTYIAGYGVFYSLFFEDTIFGRDDHCNLVLLFKAGYKEKDINVDFYLKEERVNSTKIGFHSRTLFGTEFSTRFSNEEVEFIPSLKTSFTKIKPENISLLLPFLYSFSYLCSLYADLSFGYRCPTMNELYWPTDVFAAGNPNLKSEKTVTFEVGVKRIYPFFFQLAGFVKKGKEVIIWVQDSLSKYRPVNAGNFFSWGIEGGIQTTKPFKLSLHANTLFGYLNEGVLPYRPRMSFSAFLSCRGFYLSGFLFLKTPDNFSGLSFMKDVYLFNVGKQISYTVGKYILSLNVVIKNMLDKNYEFIEGYPLPGRRCEVSLTINSKEVP